ncbi:MAG: hypothetical protein ACRD6B_00935, partial [Bryobacteraceae bacterium]
FRPLRRSVGAAIRSQPELSNQCKQGQSRRSYRGPPSGRIGKKDYYNYVDPSNTTVCYARVAYLTGLTAGTHVLLAGGPHIASTEAACLFLTRHESLSEVRKLFHLSSSGHLPYFELLIQARALGNAPWEMKIVAGRIVPGE